MGLGGAEAKGAQRRYEDCQSADSVAETALYVHVHQPVVALALANIFVGP